jgi:xanthine/CO dehydrogenase XdhC/CoxF family maturation factor
MLERIDRETALDPLGVFERSYRSQAKAALVTIFRSETDRIRPGARAVAWADGSAETAGIDALFWEKIVPDARDVLAREKNSGFSYSMSPGSVDALIEAVVPPIRLFVFGTGHDALPVVDLGRALGWDVIICERVSRARTRERFALADQILAADECDLVAAVDGSARAAAIVMGHDFEHDKQTLELLLGTHAAYIGVLGAGHRSARLFEELSCDPSADSRIHAPVGLEIGAETPREIALAVVAEVQAALAHASLVHRRKTLRAIRLEVA